MKVYSKSQLERIVQIDDAVIEIIEKAFSDLVTKSVQMPPIMRMDIAESNGEVDVKSAHVSGEDSFAIKVSTGFFNNYKYGLPSASGLMILLNAKTGVPQAIYADEGYLTDIRTAVAGAVAAKHLAKEVSPAVGVIGTGAQARLQVEAFAKVRKVHKVFVYGRTWRHANRYKKEMEDKLRISVELKDSIKDVVVASDTVITTTPSSEPVIQGSWLHSGLHITAVGSDAEHKRELASDVLELAEKVVCDKQEQSIRLGELKGDVPKEIVNNAVELGEITAGRMPGRETDDEVTVCDLTGTGIQDTAIARYVYELIRGQ